MDLSQALSRSSIKALAWAFRVGMAGFYRRPLAPVLTTNVRWLSRYRHRRCLVPEVAEPLLDVFAQGRGLFAGAALVGERIRVLPVLFHLMWHGRLVANLTGGPLGASTIVRTGAA